MSTITLKEGIISLTDAAGTVIQIREMPMSQFEEFYKHWHLAASLQAEDGTTFTSLWVFHKEFRANMEHCLKVAGIEHPELLKPVQIRELLLGNEDSLPFLFLLNLELPDPKLIRAMTAPSEETNSTSPVVAEKGLLSVLRQRVGL